MSDILDYVDESIRAIENLKKVKADLYNDVSEVKVSYNKDDSPAIQTSVDQVFGEIDNSDPRKGHITFDMYMQCLRIIKAAGSAKAQAVLAKGL